MPEQKQVCSLCNEAEADLDRSIVTRQLVCSSCGERLLTNFRGICAERAKTYVPDPDPSEHVQTPLAKPRTPTKAAKSAVGVT